MISLALGKRRWCPRFIGTLQDQQIRFVGWCWLYSFYLSNHHLQLMILSMSILWSVPLRSPWSAPQSSPGCSTFELGGNLRGSCVEHGYLRHETLVHHKWWVYTVYTCSYEHTRVDTCTTCVMMWRGYQWYGDGIQDTFVQTLIRSAQGCFLKCPKISRLGAEEVYRKHTDLYRLYSKSQKQLSCNDLAKHVGNLRHMIMHEGILYTKSAQCSVCRRCVKF